MFKFIGLLGLCLCICMFLLVCLESPSAFTRVEILVPTLLLLSTLVALLLSLRRIHSFFSEVNLYLDQEPFQFFYA